MTDKEADEQLTIIAGRAKEIRAGLDTTCTEEQLQRPASRRLVHALIATVTATTAAKMRTLSARIEALEESGIRYQGVFQRATSYARGDTVTHAGSLWVALKIVPVGNAPGSDSAYWQLAAKGGRPVKRPTAGSRST
ncbi:MULTISPECIES: transposase [Rhizobium]|uniref:transposase n=1 Tax=Rhizobium TaxID=379 RepID=UPI0010315677|nr:MULTISPECIES: transposase [Rhizobium]MBY5483249.1 transposase [Rhizobium leguminosarum]NEI28469.1 transposase [Rhizobium ruizarguesonis]NKL64992.1 transposase [Rhizobium leguminosarum bv. viciae]TBA81186.1 transposase [Rhizobium ruizarguesonis]TBZ64516.1 transposase [Rhizobium leguminosarum bv. viciae]